jgi:hypothetical protein
LDREARVTREDLEKVRSELSGELKRMSPAQRREYLKAAGEVYDGLAKMAKIRPIKA